MFSLFGVMVLWSMAYFYKKYQSENAEFSKTLYSVQLLLGFFFLILFAIILSSAIQFLTGISSLLVLGLFAYVLSLFFEHGKDFYLNSKYAQSSGLLETETSVANNVVLSMRYLAVFSLAASVILPAIFSII
jgi:hypothetical protein